MTTELALSEALALQLQAKTAEALTLQAERDEAVNLLRWVRGEIFEHRDNIPAPGKYLTPIDAFLGSAR